ncbi:MAG: hypothetical protein ACR2G5_03390 [Pyrinomonadaceae bacterium]
MKVVFNGLGTYPQVVSDITGGLEDVSMKVATFNGERDLAGLWVNVWMGYGNYYATLELVNPTGTIASGQFTVTP